MTLTHAVEFKLFGTIHAVEVILFLHLQCGAHSFG